MRPFIEASAAQISPSRDAWAARHNASFGTIKSRMLAVAIAGSTAGGGTKAGDDGPQFRGRASVSGQV